MYWLCNSQEVGNQLDPRPLRVTACTDCPFIMANLYPSGAYTICKSQYPLGAKVTALPLYECRKR